MDEISRPAIGRPGARWWWRMPNVRAQGAQVVRRCPCGPCQSRSRHRRRHGRCQAPRPEPVARSPRASGRQGSASKGSWNRCSTPSLASRLARASAFIRRKGGASGAKNWRGCGSKVMMPKGPWPRARSITDWWPRCTPSKLPMATEAPRADGSSPLPVLMNAAASTPFAGRVCPVSRTCGWAPEPAPHPSGQRFYPPRPWVSRVTRRFAWSMAVTVTSARTMSPGRTGAMNLKRLAQIDGAMARKLFADHGRDQARGQHAVGDAAFEDGVLGVVLRPDGPGSGRWRLRQKARYPGRLPFSSGAGTCRFRCLRCRSCRGACCRAWCPNPFRSCRDS